MDAASGPLFILTWERMYLYYRYNREEENIMNKRTGSTYV